MFKRKISVELSGAASQRLVSLGEDMQFLITLATDMLEQHKQLLDMVRTDIVIAVDQVESGTEIFDEAEPELRKSGKPRRFSKRVEMPQEMREPIPRPETIEGDEAKLSPFTRASRGQQIRWLVEVMAHVEPEGWVAPHEIAEEYANDPGHRRYLRRVIPRRLAEMYEDQEAPMERRRYAGRGSMFEYRLKR